MSDNTLILKISGAKVTLKPYITKGDTDWVQEPNMQTLNFNAVKGTVETDQSKVGLMVVESNNREVAVKIAKLEVGEQVFETREDIMKQLQELPIDDYTQLAGFQTGGKK